jgi:glycerol-3-phosphate dehydrogenase
MGGRERPIFRVVAPDTVRCSRGDIVARLEDRKTPFDLVVIGGGANGAGIALDAASRGLSVALLEKGDFGSGTSSRSSKLIHGGVR